MNSIRTGSSDLHVVCIGSCEIGIGHTDLGICFFSIVFCSNDIDAAILPSFRACLLEPFKLSLSYEAVKWIIVKFIFATVMGIMQICYLLLVTGYLADTF